MNRDTNCPNCGNNLPEYGYFCNGYTGHYDADQCQCDCHWNPNHPAYPSGRVGRTAAATKPVSEPPATVDTWTR